MVFRRCVLVYLMSLLFAVPWAQGAAKRLLVGVYQDHIQTIQSLPGTPCPSLQQTAQTNNQMLLEYAILCHVLTDTQDDSSEVTLQLVPFPVEDRLVRMLRAQRIDVSGFGVWRSQLQSNDVPLGPPLLREGEFSKGLYTRERDVEAYSSLLPAQWSSLLAVVNHNWQYDWQALGCAGFQRKHVDRYGQMFELIARGRADVVPLSFGNQPDMVKREYGVTLYPVEGVKLVFPSSTHYAISPGSAHRVWLTQRIEQGLADLRRDGTLQRLYQRAGILNAQTNDWTALCPADETNPASVTL
ncbi:hypothetical protein LJ739_17945 [Aestuariibacter halophilus]|uniref:Bacterial extracellular solute-binding proteins, family 3 n=1 Tax=Fluctibacter halophilus TaxID=226011 RepID=A0ABS8GCB3_9ALTE|nr:hypothetical protein [Aestuariibacter halophilus]MCC2618143.1 hypothetical protein [Aestuariibacter halophilus]